MGKFALHICFFLFSLAFLISIGIASNPEFLDSQIGYIHTHYHHLPQHKAEDKIGVYELNKGNFSIKVTNYGATVISVILPDKYGKLADVVLGYDTIKQYMNDTTYFGAIVGRVANRIGGARYTYDGVEYKLVPNEGKNMLHGGPKGFSRRIWKVTKYDNEGQRPFITFSYFSKDGEEGFPGDLLVSVTYRIGLENNILVSMSGKALNKPTPVNLAQHTYWNLGGHNSGSILDHQVQIFGSHITPVDEYLIPTGKSAAVKGTPYDFLKPHTVGSRISELPNGYDINYALDQHSGRSKTTRASLSPVAVVRDNKSGRVMELWTNKPGVQFYTANMLAHEKGKGGYVYGPHAALCLETQAYPDAVNHPNFPSVMVTPGEPYRHVMLFKFSTLS